MPGIIDPLAVGELLVGTVVAQGVGSAPEQLAQPRQVEVCVGEGRVQLERALVVRGGRRGAARVLEGQGQVEVDHGVLGRDAERVAVEPRGLSGVAGVVGQATQVHVRVHQIGIVVEGPRVGLAGRRRVVVLELESQLEGLSRLASRVVRGGLLLGAVAQILDAVPTSTIPATTKTLTV